MVVSSTMYIFYLFVIYNLLESSAFTISSSKFHSLSHRNMKTIQLNRLSHKLQLFPDPTILPSFYQALSLNAVQAVLLKVIKQKFLTDAGLLHSTALGIGLWTFLGFKGWLFCVIYLVLGNIVTKIRMKEKEVH